MSIIKFFSYISFHIHLQPRHQGVVRFQSGDRNLQTRLPTYPRHPGVFYRVKHDEMSQFGNINMKINSYELLCFQAHHFSGIIELTIFQVPMWPCSSVVERLYRSRKGHGFESCRRLKFFQAQIATPSVAA